MPVDSLCCDEGVTTCGGQYWRQCWAQRYDYPVDVTVGWALTDEARRGVVVYRVAPPPGATLQFPVFTQAVVRFPGRAERYCVEVEARDLIAGTTARTQVCADQLEAVDRSAIEAPDIGQCTGDIVDAETREVVIRKTGAGAGDVGGCSAGGGASALTMLALLGLRRRR